MASAGGLADEDAIQIELGTVGVRDTAQAQDSTAVLSPASGSDPSSAQGSAASVAEFAEDDAGAGVAPGSSKCGAVTNFVNSIIGAGIIGLPFALREAGLVGGLILILLVGLATGVYVCRWRLWCDVCATEGLPAGSNAPLKQCMPSMQSTHPASHIFRPALQTTAFALL